MNLANASYAILPAALLCAVAFDLRCRRIPNRLLLSGVAIAFSLHGVAIVNGAPAVAGSAWWSSAFGLAAGLTLMLPLYLLRAMGAGDVKLMAMVGAFIGAPAVVSAVIYTLLAGGLLSLICMVGHGVAAQTWANLRVMLFSSGGLRAPPLQATAARMPYALAIAAGTAAALRWPLLGP